MALWGRTDVLTCTPTVSTQKPNKTENQGPCRGKRWKRNTGSLKAEHSMVSKRDTESHLLVFKLRFSFSVIDPINY